MNLGIIPVNERPGRIEYLFLTSDQREKQQAFDHAVDSLPVHTTLRCRVPEIRMDKDGTSTEYYEHVDYDERLPPTEVEAFLMCSTRGVICPVAEQCRAYAHSLKPEIGVWGGEVWDGGKVMKEREE